ncbi:sensor histidine kinase [Mucilaginibacter galii]|nr:ATP-binding protein [Mucilaginibacter galii]
MHFFPFLAAFLLIRHLQRSLKFSPLLPKWKNMFWVGTATIVVLFFAFLKDKHGVLNDFVGVAVLGSLLYYLYNEPDFKPFHSYLFSHLPLLAAAFIGACVRLINEDFYEDFSSVFQIAIVGAFIWIFARVANSKKQDEALRVAAERKAELEALVKERTAELTLQKNELEQAVTELKSTQAQLIQAEKMASLGELTAGIAHEIQNPLNFVNNFSEVSMELIEEMEQELERGDIEEAIAIASDVKQNLEKIGFHGKRADGIVKGMLQHSRASTGQKELADINVLADEYFRLSYHGLRAKDKSFNATLVTNFTPGLPQVNIIQQDVGRVILNLFNNAFYAVQQRQKQSSSDYKPTVEVSTALLIGFIQIRIKDNGTGIPDEIKEKIMQPFFTTKPTGEGTGLGLSLSYDIIVKAHNGTIDIDSKENDYTQFTIKLPLTN